MTENNPIDISYIETKPLKKVPEKLPWPRVAKDNPDIKLGIDVVVKRPDIIKLVHKFFHVDGISMEELLQEVYAAIIHKNYTRSAHDPRKSSFGHYVYMVANNVCINLVHKKKRYDRESDSIYEVFGDDDKPLAETAIAEEPTNYVASEAVEALEENLRKKNRFDLARFIRATRSGASADIIKAALSYGNRTVNNKHMREMRHEISSFVTSSSYSAI